MMVPEKVLATLAAPKVSEILPTILKTAVSIILTPERVSDPGFKTLLASCIFKTRSKQFVYQGPGVGVLGQPPGDVVEGDVEAAGVVALPAERSSRRC